MACAAHPRLPCHALPIRDCPVMRCLSSTHAAETGQSMTAERHRSAPIFDLLRQAYPRLPNRAPPNRTRPSPTLPGHSTSHHDCLDKPNTSVLRPAHQSHDCRNAPIRTLHYQSATRQTSTASPRPSYPSKALPSLTKSQAFTEPYTTVNRHRCGETPPSRR